MSFSDSSLVPDSSTAATMVQASRSSGTFISPQGRVLRVHRDIHEITEHPEAFGLKRAEVEHIYGQYHESIGSAGSARQEILVALVKHGWLRVRQNTPSNYIVNAAYRDRGTRERLTAWAQGMLTGTLGGPEADRFATVLIRYPDEVEETDLDAIAEYGLFSRDEPQPPVLPTLHVTTSPTDIPQNEIVPVELPH